MKGKRLKGFGMGVALLLAVLLPTRLTFNMSAQPSSLSPFTFDLLPGSSVLAQENCTASTPNAFTVQLTTGPGYERAVVAYLPADTEVPVVGRATAGDGGEWVRLDKAVAAPNTAAAEVWAPVAEINLNCAGGTDEANATEIVGAPGGALSPGLWALAAGRASYTCPDGTVDGFDLPFGEQRLSLAVAGDGFTLGADAFTLAQPGIYVGTFDVTGVEAQVTWQVITAGALNGLLQFSGDVGEQTCTFGIPLTLILVDQA